MPLFIAAIAFLLTLVIWVIAYSIFLAPRRNMAVRIDQYTNLPNLQANPQTRNESGTRRRDVWKFIRLLSKYFESPHWSRSIEHKLTQAGIPMRGSEYLVVWIVVIFLMSCALFFLMGENIVSALSGGLLGYLLPHLFLQIKIKQRAQKFNSQLGDTLILIANSLRTGYSFMQALDMVSREMPEPISLEFGRVLKEINLGILAEEALNNLAKRVDSEDLDLVITVVLIQRQIGGNLAEILDNIAETIRGRVRIKGQIKTLTAQGRISGVVIGGMPIALAIIMFGINPDYIRLLFTEPLGQIMVGGALLGQGMGVFLIRKIINIDI